MQIRPRKTENKGKIAFDVTEKLQQTGQKEGSKLCFRKMLFAALVHMDINGPKLKKPQHCTQNAIQVLHDLNEGTNLQHMITILSSVQNHFRDGNISFNTSITTYIPCQQWKHNLKIKIEISLFT